MGCSPPANRSSSSPRTGDGKPGALLRNPDRHAQERSADHHGQSREWEPPHGTRVEIELMGTYKKGTAFGRRLHPPNRDRQPALRDFLYASWTPERQHLPRGIRNPPAGTARDQAASLWRRTRRPHQDDEGDVGAATQPAPCNRFFAGERRVADEICKAADFDPNANPHTIAVNEAERLYKAINSVKIMSPADKLPLSDRRRTDPVRTSKRKYAADFYTAITRTPSVYRGNPFQVEVGWPTAALCPGMNWSTCCVLPTASRFSISNPAARSQKLRSASTGAAMAFRNPKARCRQGRWRCSFTSLRSGCPSPRKARRRSPPTPKS